jgi:hypothetical protein
MSPRSFADLAPTIVEMQGVIGPIRAIRQAEVGASRMMLDRTAERFGLKPQHLAADSAYSSTENLA